MAAVEFGLGALDVNGPFPMEVSSRYRDVGRIVDKEVFVSPEVHQSRSVCGL